MPDTFGARLRRQREQRQIPLSTIADQTKISISILQGLEADDVARWPAGIFRRAFVRTYAAAIGLEPEVVVREFLQIHPDPAEMAPIPCDGAAVATTGSNDTAVLSRFRSLAGSALGSLGRLPLIGRRHSDDGSSAPTAAVNCRTASESCGSGAEQTTFDLVQVVGARDTPAPAGEGATPPTETLHVDVAVVSDPSVQASATWNPDVAAAAQLCTDFARVDNVRELTTLLPQAARSLGAAGLIVWVSDSQTNRLWPALAHGYAEKVLAQVSPLRCDEDNATAAAFRTAQTSIVTGSNTASGAIVVPLMARGGCVGVLAIEFHDRTEQNQLVRALATIFGALLARLVGDTRSSVDHERRLA
jgi:hypothetical protein